MAYELIAIGSSWGGSLALAEVLGGLPARFPAAIVIAQHRSADSPARALADRLAALSALPVTEPSDKDPILPGQAYVAPADYHLLVESGSFALSTDERVQHSRPSIDVLFESAAEAYGSRLIGVVLTGASEDGAAGLARVRERGGLTIVQDPETAERRRMPEAAIAAGAAQGVLPLAEIAPLLVELCAAGLGKWSTA